MGPTAIVVCLIVEIVKIEMHLRCTRWSKYAGKVESRHPCRCRKAGSFGGIASTAIICAPLAVGPQTPTEPACKREKMMAMDAWDKSVRTWVLQNRPCVPPPWRQEGPPQEAAKCRQNAGKTLHVVQLDPVRNPVRM